METKFKRTALELPAVEEISIDPLQHELAVKAKQLLGYGLLEAHLQGGVVNQTRERTDLLTNLIKNLNELDIQPFNTQEVELYKRQEEQRMNRKSFRALPIYVQLFQLIEKLFTPLENKSDTVFGGTLVTLFGCVLVEAVSLFVRQWLVAGIFSPFALLGLGGLYVLAIENRVRGLKLRQWEWVTLSFGQCHNRGVEVPPFALDTAIRIKEKMPSAFLSVETLMSTDLVLGDPFLCVQYGDTKYYIEVWDEFRFERQTTRRV